MLNVDEDDETHEKKMKQAAAAEQRKRDEITTQNSQIFFYKKTKEREPSCVLTFICTHIDQTHTSSLSLSFYSTHSTKCIFFVQQNLDWIFMKFFHRIASPPYHSFKRKKDDIASDSASFFSFC